MVTRREVVSALAGISGLTTLGIPVAAAQTPGRRADLRLQKGEKLVMIGDSITDVGRAKPIGEGRADDALGRGYVMMVDALLGAVYPERMIRVINMGVSGNTTRDLKARWQSDVLDLKPDWLSIMIGANDVWRQYDSPKQTAGAGLVHNAVGEGPHPDDAVLHRAEPAGRDARDDGQVQRRREAGRGCDSGQRVRRRAVRFRSTAHHLLSSRDQLGPRAPE
jgi:hypothetical protein